MTGQGVNKTSSAAVWRWTKRTSAKCQVSFLLLPNFYGFSPNLVFLFFHGLSSPWTDVEKWSYRKDAFLMYKITENLLCSTGSTQCPVVTQMGCCLSCSVRSNSFVTPWTVALQYPLPMGFSRQEHWSGLPFPSPEDLSDPGIKPTSPALAKWILLFF